MPTSFNSFICIIFIRRVIHTFHSNITLSITLNFSHTSSPRKYNVHDSITNLVKKYPLPSYHFSKHLLCTCTKTFCILNKQCSVVQRNISLVKRKIVHWVDPFRKLCKDRRAVQVGDDVAVSDGQFTKLKKKLGGEMCMLE